MANQADMLADFEPEVHKWASETIREWQKKIRALNISGDALVNSFVYDVAWASGGNLKKILFAFDYVGKFTEWGIGNGVSIQTRDALISAGLTKRRPKPWLNEVFRGQVAKLREDIALRMGGDLGLLIARDIEAEIVRK